MRKITPEDIQELKPNEVFVFGSNESGMHIAGAAKLAKEKFGAIEGQGFGPMGNSFGIPTMGWNAEGTTSPAALECFIARFCQYAEIHPEKEFLITKIGCGIAGYEPKDVAKTFIIIRDLPNISLPQEFWDVIDGLHREFIIKEMIFENDGTKNEF